MLHIINGEIINLNKFIKIIPQGDLDIACKHEDTLKHEIIKFDTTEARDEEYSVLLQKINKLKK